MLEAAEEAGDPRGFVEKLVARFGAERVMWGSDFSQTHDRPYAALARLGRDAFSSLDPEQQRSCLGLGAERLWFPSAPIDR